MISALPSAAVRVRVPAKINLHLSVGGLRPDGYHELVSVFHAVSLFDELTITPADELTVVTNAADVPAGADNLAGRAALLLAEHAGRSPQVKIEIAKHIPVAGGMAGGSADAAGALLGCAHLWRLDLTRAEMAGLAARLGSDVPFALTGGTAVGTGRGEQLVPVLARHQLHWVLAIAVGGLSTPTVFAELDRLREQSPGPRVGAVEPLLGALTNPNPAALAEYLGNDLQAAAISLQPGLRRVLFAGAEEGALNSLVSGSGPTVAMLSRGAEHAADLAARIAGLGVCRAVRVVSGPVSGARLVTDHG
jgi:4-diphosphocytidyl-2-C-methyl-D-erythritol kinase